MSNLQPEQMTARNRTCECGHVEALHWSFNDGGACAATVYTHGLKQSETVTKCRCSRFTEKV